MASSLARGSPVGHRIAHEAARRGLFSFTSPRPPVVAIEGGFEPVPTVSILRENRSIPSTFFSEFLFDPVRIVGVVLHQPLQMEKALLVHGGKTDGRFPLADAQDLRVDGDL